MTRVIYSNKIIIMSGGQVKNLTSRVIKEGNNIVLNINEEKTKYLIVLLRQYHQNSISVGDITYEKLSNFKYLRVDVNERENNHEEIIF